MGVGITGLIVISDEINVDLFHQKSEMGDTGMEAVHAHWADILFHWKIKNSQQILHNRKLLLSQKHMLW